MGKTSIMHNLKEKQQLGFAKPTIGAEFHSVKVKLPESETEVNLQMWDTAGQERFQSLCKAFYRGTDCCVLVYDVTSQRTYDSLERWQR